MPLGGSSSDGGAAAQEAARQKNIDTGMGQINDLYSKYDNNFYGTAANNYTSYATPQIMSQYQATKNNLAYSLARNGLLRSGAAVKDNAALGKTLAQNQTNIANQAQDQANTLRNSVQDSRTNLTNQLISSADPSTVSENATAATAGLNAPQAYTPLSNMFQDFSNTYLTNMNARAYNPATASVWSQLGFGNN